MIFTDMGEVSELEDVEDEEGNQLLTKSEMDD
jgi:hypothetical protein